MNKRILIAVMVCVLAIGTMGAAFATTMTVTGVGALSEGTEAIPTVNVDDVSYNLDDFGSVKEVVLSFDKYLYADTEIVVKLQNASGTDLATGKLILSADLLKADSVIIDLNRDPVNTVESMTQLQVVVAE